MPSALIAMKYCGTSWRKALQALDKQTFFAGCNVLNMSTADYWIDRLKLQSHPEGGYYKETYRSVEKIPSTGLPSRFNDARNFCTSIYFLLQSKDRSFFHRIKSDELWHFHAGTSLLIYVLRETGLEILKLGPNHDAGENLQVVIPANHWFGAMVKDENSYTLSGCTVSPGFDFDDFEIGSREDLVKQFPSFTNIIEMFTPSPR